MLNIFTERALKFISMTETGTATSDKLTRKRFCDKLDIKF